MLYTTNLVGSYTFNNLGRTIQYTYDGSGNIATRTDTTNGTSLTTEYFYDELNQLIRENDPVANKTITYTYDNGGNILQKKEYAYTTGALGTVKRTINYTYDSEWKDLLIKYGNLSVTYDEIGNPITFDGATLTWEQGRKLSSITMADGSVASYKYDANGVRTQKTVAGVTTDYFLQGSTIVAQKTGNNVIWYYFDGDGTRDAIEYNGNVYYYMYNPQGDVIGLFDDNLNVVVEYTYDSWGKILSITGSLASTLGQDNPFRYRGYYYDSETGMYYLNSRYYHPEIGRFINGDGIVDTQTGMLSHNMFTYCNNNPVNYSDETGCLTGLEIAFGIIATIIVSIFVATLLKEPYSVDDALKDTGDSIAEKVIPGLDKANNIMEFGDTVSSIDTEKGKYIDDIMRSDGSFSPQSFNPTICSSNEKYALYCLEMSDNLSRYASYHSISLQGKTFADLSIDEQKTLIDGMIIWDTGMCFDIHMSKGVRGVFALFT